MGCYGIGVTRMAAAWIEQNHDDKGIIWSPQIAPYHVHLIGAEPRGRSRRGSRPSRSTSSSKQEGIEVLFDDRPLRAGEKFSDADLIGIPVRLTISKRTLEQGKVEFKLRRGGAVDLVTLEESIQRVKGLLAESK